MAITFWDNKSQCYTTESENDCKNIFTRVQWINVDSQKRKNLVLCMCYRPQKIRSLINIITTWKSFTRRSCIKKNNFRFHYGLLLLLPYVLKVCSVLFATLVKMLQHTHNVLRNNFFNNIRCLPVLVFTFRKVHSKEVGY